MKQQNVIRFVHVRAAHQLDDATTAALTATPDQAATDEVTDMVTSEADAAPTPDDALRAVADKVRARGDFLSRDPRLAALLAAAEVLHEAHGVTDAAIVRDTVAGALADYEASASDLLADKDALSTAVWRAYLALALVPDAYHRERRAALFMLRALATLGVWEDDAGLRRAVQMLAQWRPALPGKLVDAIVGLDDKQATPPRAQRQQTQVPSVDDALARHESVLTARDYVMDLRRQRAANLTAATPQVDSATTQELQGLVARLMDIDVSSNASEDRKQLQQQIEHILAKQNLAEPDAPLPSGAEVALTKAEIDACPGLAEIVKTKLGAGAVTVMHALENIDVHLEESYGDVVRAHAAAPTPMGTQAKGQNQ